MKKGLLLAATMLAMGAAGVARAETVINLTEVITSPQRTELLRGLLDKFEAANPGVKVAVTSLPWGQAFEKLATMVQGGETPDVVEMPERWVSLYATSGQLASLEPKIAQWDGAEELSERVLQYGSVVGGTPYMIPYGFYIRAMFWNKKLFKEAGLDHPPATMDEFVAASRKISALGNGKTGYCLRGGTGSANGYSMFMLTMNGSPDYFDKDGNSTLDQPGAVKGLQTLVDMYKEGLVPRDSVNWGFNEIVAGFYSGTCAMLDQDPDALIAIKERMNPEDFAVAPMPLGPGGKAFPTLGFAGWSMFETAKDKEASWKLISFLSSPESNLAWSKFVGVVPIHKSSQADPFFNSEQFKGWFTELNDPRWEPTPVPAHLPEYGYWSDSIAVQTGQEALLGQRTAEDVASEWASYFTEAQKKWLAAHPKP
jgi:multiple sugar transport system substrate-binding protein